MPRPDGPQFTAYEQELLNAVERRTSNTAPLGRGSSGPLGPLDADQIARTASGKKNMEDFGFTLKDIGSRGFALEMDDPDISVTAGAHPEVGGFQVRLDHSGRFESNEDGSYKYPEDWGTVRGHLDVTEHELPTALMDWMSSPEVRRHMMRPDRGTQ